MRHYVKFAVALMFIQCLFGEGLRVEINSISQAQFPEIDINFTVYDQSGRALQDVQRKNITLSENGLNVSNYHMEISNDPVELALVLDDSGSMHYNLKLLIKAVKKFIGFLEGRDRAAIYSFSDTVKLLQNFTNRKPDLTDSLEKLKGYGATALYDAIYQAAESLSETKKTAIVVLSDGIDQNRDNTGSISNKSAIDAVTLAVRKKIPIHTIGLGRRINRQELKDFARLSRGAFYYAPTATQLSDLYALIARNLKSDVKIKYISPNDKKDATYRNLDLEIRSRNLSGRIIGNYFTPGRFIMETKGFGYEAKKPKANRDSQIKILLTDDNGIQKTGGKEFLNSWINQLGK
ncbi:MAG: VWA domain-containing protein [bacterium]|nr:VWA domain-containing protein [bacterium]